MQRPTHHPQEVLRGANRMRSAAPSSKRLQVRIFLLGICAGNWRKRTGDRPLGSVPRSADAAEPVVHARENPAFLRQRESHTCSIFMLCAASFRGDLQLSRARRARPTREPLEIR